MKTKQVYLVLALCCAAYIFSMFHRVAPTVLATDLMADLSLTSAQVGMLSGATLAAYGLMQLPSGILADVLGGRAALSLMLAICGLSVLWFAQSDSMGSLLLARAGIGLGAAITVPAMVLLASCVPPHAYARATSILLCSGGIGSLLAASPLAFSIQLYGWRLPMIFTAALTLGVGVLVWCVVRNPRPAASRSKVSWAEIGHAIKSVLKTRSFWLLSVWLMTMPGIYFLFGGLWWGPYLIQGNGLSEMDAGLVISVGAASILLGQPLLGYLSDNVIKGRKLFLVAGPLLTLCSALMMLFFTGAMSLEVLMLQGILFLMGTNNSPIAFTMLKESFPPAIIGTAVGCANIFYPLWSALMQNVFGMVLDDRLITNGQNMALAFADTSYIYIAHCIVAFIVALFTVETYRK